MKIAGLETWKYQEQIWSLENVACFGRSELIAITLNEGRVSAASIRNAYLWGNFTEPLNSLQSYPLTDLAILSMRWLYHGY